MFALFMFALFIFALSGCGEEGITAGSSQTVTAPKLDRSDPKSVAIAALTAYQQHDFGKLAKISTSMNQKIFSELSGQGAEHPRYNSVVTGGRWDAVEDWDGAIGEIRDRGEDYVFVEFAKSPYPDEVYVVALELEEGKWAFEDINSPPRSMFIEYPIRN